MNTDDFEKRLQRQPLRQAPTEWRAEILSAARQAALPEHAPRTTHYASPSLLSALHAHLVALLWPRPAAWAGLAVLWVAILGLNLATHEASPRLARAATPPSPQLCVAFQEQARLLVELIGPPEPPVAQRPKSVLPRPRSERQPRMLMA